MAMLGAQIGTFLVWTIGVALLTWLICMRSMKKSSNAAEEYFSGGRALAWYVVAGSLMLTNLSTEQLVGLNGVIFADGCLAGTAWETFAALAMCITAAVFLPRYFKSGLATTTGFLGKRFDLTTRTIVSSVFLVFYAVGLCPSVLYTGALGMKNIFDLDIPLWVVSTSIGFIGACYAIFGGLKAVAVSDCLNGVGLLIVGLWVPIAALQRIGGLSGLFAEPTFIRPMVSESEVFDDETGTRSMDVPSMPWHVTISGLMLQNLYYWSTNQLIVQRALAARSLAEGQKGVLFAASMKVVGFVVLCLPGVIGALMVKNGVSIDGKPFVVEKADTVYPLLVKAVMPEWSLGFFAAVLLGSILSTFNSALQSASTLFGLEIYKIYINPSASDDRVVKVASGFAVILSLASFVIAPSLAGVKSIFDWLQRAKTMASLPIISTFLVGIATVTPDAFAAKVGFVVGGILYGAGQFVKKPHFLHIFMICFCVSLVSMVVATYVQPFRKLFRQPASKPFIDSVTAVVDVQLWPMLYPVIGCIFFLVALLTVSLQVASQPLFLVFCAAWIIVMGSLIMLPSWRPPLAEKASDAENATATPKAEDNPTWAEDANASLEEEVDEANTGTVTV